MATLTGTVHVKLPTLGRVAFFPINFPEDGLPLGGINQTGFRGRPLQLGMRLVEPFKNRLPRRKQVNRSIAFFLNRRDGVVAPLGQK